jgi:hypothetical protein
VLLFVEVKAAGRAAASGAGRVPPACVDADVAHLVGGLDAVIAWLVERGYIRAESVPHYRQPAPEARS